jgi:hypothetical protein
MNFSKMSVKQIFQPLLLLIRISQLMGWRKLDVLADRATSPQRQIACFTQDP